MNEKDSATLAKDAARRAAEKYQHDILLNKMRREEAARAGERSTSAPSELGGVQERAFREEMRQLFPDGGNKRYQWVGNGVVEVEASLETEMAVRRDALSLAVQMWRSTGLSFSGEASPSDNYLAYTTRMADVFVEYIRDGKRYFMPVDKSKEEQKDV